MYLHSSKLFVLKYWYFSTVSLEKSIEHISMVSWIWDDGVWDFRLTFFSSDFYFSPPRQDFVIGLQQNEVGHKSYMG